MDAQVRGRNLSGVRVKRERDIDGWVQSSPIADIHIYIHRYREEGEREWEEEGEAPGGAWEERGQQGAREERIIISSL